MTSVSVDDSWGKPIPESRCTALARCLSQICVDNGSLRLLTKGLDPFQAAMARQGECDYLADSWLGSPEQRIIQLAKLGTARNAYSKMVDGIEDKTVDDLHRACVVIQAFGEAIEIVGREA